MAQKKVQQSQLDPSISFGGSSTSVAPSQSRREGWAFPDSVINAATDIQLIIPFYALKPIWYEVNSTGTLVLRNSTSFGTNFYYNATNAQIVRANATEAYVNVSLANAAWMDVLCSNSTKRTTAVNALNQFCIDNTFTGVELDWEDFGSWTTTQYANFKIFVNQLGVALHASGFKLIIDAPPIWNNAVTTTANEWTARNSQGYYKFKYEDFDTLPVDYLCVMAYDYEYDMSAGTPNSPIAWMEDVIKWAKLKITDKSRITAGIPAAGYSGATGGYTISNRTYKYFTTATGFGTATRDSASQEMHWANAGIDYWYMDDAAIDAKVVAAQNLGITRVSLWHIGDNKYGTLQKDVSPIPTPAGNDTQIQKVEIGKAGSLIATRKRINLIEGTNVTITVADDSVNNEVDVTINSTATGGGTGTPIPTLIVAASNAPTDWITAADYVCDGIADDVQINAAVAAAKASGNTVQLSPGTFNIAATITFTGTGNVNTGTTRSFFGCGMDSTILNIASNVNGIALNDTVKVNIADIGLIITGTSNGFTSTASTTTPWTSFWLSSFRNIHISGPFSSSHTGWGMKLGSPFRSTFENIEMSGVRNGIQLYTEHALQNPGDTTFTRMFIELAGGAGVAYHLRGNVNADCTMNQCLFQMCEGIADGSTGTTGILLDGVGLGSASWNKFISTNLEQFETLINVANGEGNRFDCNYIEARPATGTVFKCGASSGNNQFSAAIIYSSSVQTLINDANTTGESNFFQQIKMLADSGSTMTVTKATSTVVFHNTKSGAGTVPSTFLA